MEPPPDTPPPHRDPPPPDRPAHGPTRIPSRRWTAALAASMLAAGVGVGAAIGPAPSASLAGVGPGVAAQLPLLIAGLEASHRPSAAAATATAPTQPPAVSAEPTPAAAPVRAAAAPASSAPPAAPPSEAAAGTEATPTPSKASRKLPAITNVWLIELAGGTFDGALAQKAAAPYIDGSLLGAATLLAGWSAPQASAFASEAVLAEPPAPGASPPLLHSIVQPPCPEGPPGAGCAPETPGQLTAADGFLKATLASITASATYKVHGLIVITFATVAVATQTELPAGASTATLAYQPPAGAALLSPFAKAGTRSTVSFNPTSPRQSLEELLR
jgi:hypothetical protein